MIIKRKIDIINKYNIDKDLFKYISDRIIPEYTKFDGGHNLEHITEVINNILEYSKYYEVDNNMSFVIGAYHDLGLSEGRKLHEYHSKLKILSDNNLKKWFTEDQIRTMAEAVEDHRASLEYEPRTIYGKLISEADRIVDPKRTIERSTKFNYERYPNIPKQELGEIVREYLIDKYVTSGRVKVWIPESGNKEKLNKLKSALLNKNEFNKYFEQAYNK